MSKDILSSCLISYCLQNLFRLIFLPGEKVPRRLHVAKEIDCGFTLQFSEYASCHMEAAPRGFKPATGVQGFSMNRTGLRPKKSPVFWPFQGCSSIAT
jgi:hypothetical protein